MVALTLLSWNSKQVVNASEPTATPLPSAFSGQPALLPTAQDLNGGNNTVSRPQEVATAVGAKGSNPYVYQDGIPEKIKISGQEMAQVDAVYWNVLGESPNLGDLIKPSVVATSGFGFYKYSLIPPKRKALQLIDLGVEESSAELIVERGSIIISKGMLREAGAGIFAVGAFWAVKDLFESKRLNSYPLPLSDFNTRPLDQLYGAAGVAIPTTKNANIAVIHSIPLPNWKIVITLIIFFAGFFGCVWLRKMGFLTSGYVKKHSK